MVRSSADALRVVRWVAAPAGTSSARTVQLTDHAVPLGHQLPAAVQQHADDDCGRLNGDASQPVMGRRGDRHRPGVVGVGLAARLARQLAGPRRQRGGDVDDVLAGCDQLLGQQTP